ncbi:MAG TPA: DUF1698 domain-containing protein, partial [Candidatus Marinimicrobia bacterium]|nr:DUF1698 domain-containing protein [Candidatus Neomarinimicrobiota bacterium]
SDWKWDRVAPHISSLKNRHEDTKNI